MLFKMLMLACMIESMACAFGSEEPQKFYGHKTPNTWDGSDPAPPFTDPNANDPYYTSCFWNPIRQEDGSMTFFYVCDGQPFTVNDLVDPAPDQKK